MFIKISYLFLCCLLTKVLCLFELCNHKIAMKAGEKLYVNSPYYPAEYPVGSSCRYLLIAPRDYKLKFSCNIKLKTPPLATTCKNEIFYFNNEGNEVLTESEYFCGIGKVERKSFLNQAVLSYMSTPGHTRLQTKTNLIKKEEELEEAHIEEKQNNKTKLTAEMKAHKKSQKIAIKTTTTTTAAPSTTSKLLKEHQLTTLTATITKPATTTTKAITVKNTLLKTSLTTPLPASFNMKVNMKSVKDVSEKDKKVNNSFAHVVTLLSGHNDKAAFATTARNSLKLLKRNTTTRTTTARRAKIETTSTSIKPTSSMPISVVKFKELLPASMWHNGSMAAYKISTKRAAKVVVGQDYTTSMASSLANTTATYKSNPRPTEGGGGGSFSCLVEVIPSPCECGRGSTVKIAGASGVAGIDEFPSMAGIMTLKNKRIFCGATIIHHRYLLSAAHCYLTTATSTAEYLTAVVGEHDVSTVMDSFYTHQYDLIKIILHEHFKGPTYQAQNDIALLKTRYAIAWNRSVGPACLPFMRLKKNREVIPEAGERVETAGWGTTSFGGQQSSILLKTTLDVIDDSTCQYLLGNLPQGAFCTYTPGHDTCQYDSGGGLYVRRERVFAVGIVSFGYACATNQPSVNTRISSYLSWIRKNTPDAKYCIR